MRIAPRFGADDAARVAVFATDSATLEACLRLADRRPDLLRVTAVITDIPGGRSSRLARAAGVRCVERSYTRLVGRASDCTDAASRAAYRDRARAFCDEICYQLAAQEDREGPFGALVFGYGRSLHGRLLARYQGRIVNQHPGDLTRLDSRRRRRLAGDRPVIEALRAAEPVVRTSTFLVDDGHDTGSILARGPAIGTAPHEATEEGALALRTAMKWASDPASLICALLLILRADVRYGPGLYPDGSREVLADRRPLPYGGIDAADLRAGLRQGLNPGLTELMSEQLRADAEQLAAGERRPYAQVR